MGEGRNILVTKGKFLVFYPHLLVECLQLPSFMTHCKRDCFGYVYLLQLLNNAQQAVWPAAHRKTMIFLNKLLGDLWHSKSQLGAQPTGIRIVIPGEPVSRAQLIARHAQRRANR